MEPRDLRVSDDERRHVAGLLERAVGQGYISLAEFEERTAAAFQARTRADLNAVLVDLPGIQLAEPSDGAPDGAYPDAGAGAGNPADNRAGGPADNRAGGARAPEPTSDQPVQIEGTGTNLVRKGEWVVPAALRVRNRWGSTYLDFTRATIEHPVVDIELDDGPGATTLVVPRSATVDCNGLTVSWGQLSSRAPTGPPHGTPHFVVRGRVRFGSVSVRARKGKRFGVFRR